MVVIGYEDDILEDVFFPGVSGFFYTAVLVLFTSVLRIHGILVRIHACD